MKKASIPKKMQALLWSADIKKLNLDRDREYIIHQVLCYGTLEDISWLFKTYTKEELVKTFISTPYKDYFPARFNYIKNSLLQLNNQSLDPKHYVKNTPRNLG